MSQSVKQLIVVLVIAAMVFHFAKSIMLKFSTESDYLRRRNVWFALTITAFLSPNFWIFAIVAAPLYIWSARRDANPIAFYLILLHVVQPIAIPIPIPGINQLFDLDNYRLLSLCLLIPTAWRLRRSSDKQRIPGLQLLDILLIAYGALQVAFFLPPDMPDHVLLHDSPTNLLRRAFLFFVDAYFLYFAVSRYCSSRAVLLEVQAALCLSAAIMAGIAIFESMRHWLLYPDIVVRWSKDATQGIYLMRGTSLRAEASAGPSLALGYLLAIGFGSWLNLKSQVQSWPYRIGMTLLLLFGLLATYSRGPWLGAALIYLSYLALGKGAFSRLLKAAAVGTALIGVISPTPLGEKIFGILPFVGGNVADANVLYRQRLAQRSWELIQAHPFFGDQLANFKLEDLRQGMGIIDFVNTYAEIAVFYGLIGLSIFLAFIVVGLYKAHRAARAVMSSDPELSRLGFSLVACIAGTLLMFASASFINSYQVISYVLIGMAAAYANLCKTSVARTPIATVPSHFRAH
jgi:hypothetical protein